MGYVQQSTATNPTDRTDDARFAAHLHDGPELGKKPVKLETETPSPEAAKVKETTSGYTFSGAVNSTKQAIDVTTSITSLVVYAGLAYFAFSAAKSLAGDKDASSLSFLYKMASGVYSLGAWMLASPQAADASGTLAAVPARTWSDTAGTVGTVFHGIWGVGSSFVGMFTTMPKNVYELGERYMQFALIKFGYGVARDALVATSTATKVVTGTATGVARVARAGWSAGKFGWIAATWTARATGWGVSAACLALGFAKARVLGTGGFVPYR